MSNGGAAGRLYGSIRIRLTGRALGRAYCHIRQTSPYLAIERPSPAIFLGSEQALVKRQQISTGAFGKAEFSTGIGMRYSGQRTGIGMRYSDTERALVCGITGIRMRY